MPRAREECVKRNNYTGPLRQHAVSYDHCSADLAHSPACEECDARSAGPRRRRASSFTRQTCAMGVRCPQHACHRGVVVGLRDLSDNCHKGVRFDNRQGVQF
eukprot:4329737-Amphidinium_carterae.1